MAKKEKIKTIGARRKRIRRWGNRGTITPKALSVMSLSLVDCAVEETADTFRKEDLEVLYDSYRDCIAICPGMYVMYCTSTCTASWGWPVIGLYSYSISSDLWDITMQAKIDWSNIYISTYIRSTCTYIPLTVVGTYEHMHVLYCTCTLHIFLFDLVSCKIIYYRSLVWSKKIHKGRLVRAAVCHVTVSFI